MFLRYVLAGLVGYLLGSINSALIVGKLSGVDIRNHGSKNAGMTNTLRVLGKKKALYVLLGDILKGVVACMFGLIISNGVHTTVLVAGLLCITGHNWPIYFGFRGGKGALTSITVLFFSDYRIALILIALFLAIVALTRYVSLGSMVAAVLLPILGLIFQNGFEFLLFALILTLMLVYRHRTNIVRLLKGEESKLNLKKTTKTAS